jgi:hypothetical protein
MLETMPDTRCVGFWFQYVMLMYVMLMYIMLMYIMLMYVMLMYVMLMYVMCACFEFARNAVRRHASCTRDTGASCNFQQRTFFQDTQCMTQWMAAEAWMASLMQISCTY